MRDFRKLTVLLTILLLTKVIFIGPCFGRNKEMEKTICIVQMGAIDQRILLYAKVVLEGVFNEKIDIYIFTHDLDYAYNKRRKQVPFLKKPYLPLHDCMQCGAPSCVWQA